PSRGTPHPRSKPFQQSVDVVEFELRAAPFAGTPAQFVEDLPRFLQNVVLGDLHVALVVSALAGGWPAERIALLAIAGALVGGAVIVAVRIAAAVAELLLHLFGDVARRLLQLVERLGLR